MENEPNRVGVTLFQANNWGSLHFSERIIWICYTFPSESNFQRYSNQTSTDKIFPSKSPKSEEKRYLCLHKRSVTSMRKCSIGQCFETDGGHFANGLKEGGTRRICKAMKDNGLHLSPFSVNLSEVRLYRLKWMVTDNQWCEYVASGNKLSE